MISVRLIITTPYCNVGSRVYCCGTTASLWWVNVSLELRNSWVYKLCKQRIDIVKCTTHTLLCADEETVMDNKK